jgi:hypothetical protein
MRFVTKVMADGIRRISLGATNCGFLTIEQCRATVTGGEFILRAQPILQSARACQTHT